MLQIRKIKPEDIEFVLQLAEETGYSQSKLLSNVGEFMICEDNGSKCGAGCLVISENKGYINWVMISEEARRKKLGSAITKALLNIAELKGVKEVYAAGLCEEFVIALGFEKHDSIEALKFFRDTLGSSEASEGYKVSMEGYFKPCMHK
jgi:N-acetylglutamate synthase-like GNAT family acetyltransferase